MVAAGRWRATAPHVKSQAGFKVNALISPLPNASWGKLAETFLAVKDDPPRLQTFINLELGEGWREHGEEIDETELAGRAERFDLEMLPEEVLAITAGIDVQDDRLEVTFVGWDHAGTAYILGHHVIWGLSTDDATWLDSQMDLPASLRRQAGDRRAHVVRVVAGILLMAEPTKFTFEATCRYALRSRLCLAGWSWSDADDAAAGIVSDALRSVGAQRPTWKEGQPEWTQDGHSPIERTACRGGPAW